MLILYRTTSSLMDLILVAAHLPLSDKHMPSLPYTFIMTFSSHQLPVPRGGGGLCPYRRVSFIFQFVNIYFLAH